MAGKPEWYARRTGRERERYVRDRLANALVEAGTVCAGMILLTLLFAAGLPAGTACGMLAGALLALVRLHTKEPYPFQGLQQRGIVPEFAGEEDDIITLKIVMLIYKALKLRRFCIGLFAGIGIVIYVCTSCFSAPLLTRPPGLPAMVDFILLAGFSFLAAVTGFDCCCMTHALRRQGTT